MSGCFVVTGSSRGVGLEICRLLLDRSYQVVGLSRTGGPLSGRRGFDWLGCDLASAEEVRRAAERIGELGREDIEGLVFNAASAHYGDALEMAPEDFDRMVAQNLTNQFLLLKLLAPRLRERAEVFYVSTSASRIPAPMMAAYAATKAAFEFFIQSVAMERGFRVHIVRPAEIDTDFCRTAGVPPEAEAASRKLSPRKVAQEVVSMLGSNQVFRNVGLRAKLIDVMVRTWPSLLLKRPSSHLGSRMQKGDKESTSDA